MFTVFPTDFTDFAEIGKPDDFHFHEFQVNFFPEIRFTSEQMEEHEMSYKIRGAIFSVYNSLGPGLLESVYEASLAFELTTNGLKVETQVPLPAYYKGEKLELGFRMDLLINDTIIIEVKSVESLNEVHHKQVLTYLKLANKRLGILVNFNTSRIDKSIFRKVNGY